MDIREIQKIIPHRHPFLLLDAIDELVKGKSITARKNVSYNESFFEGHFPSDPVMPGFLIIESLAQAGAVLILSMEEFKNKKVYLASIEKTRFYKKVIPGDVLVLNVKVISSRGKIVKCFGDAHIAGDKCAKVEFACAIE